MKKLSIVILIILLLIPTTVWGDYTIDTSNSVIENNWIKDTYLTVEKVEENYVDVDNIKQALDLVRFNYKQDFTVHVVDYYMHSILALGLALPDNRIIIFDIIPGRMDEMYQNVVVHELGHLVYNSMNEWQQGYYKILRGIPEDWDNYPRTDYVNRPTEVFAEDFRILFGGEDASKGPHFNQELTHCSEIKGLRRFIRTLEVTRRQ